MIAFINLTGIHAPGATDTLAHIDNRPFTAIHALYHSNSPGRTDTDAAATTFTFKSNKSKKIPHHHKAMWQHNHPISDQTVRQYNPVSYYNI